MPGVINASRGRTSARPLSPRPNEAERKKAAKSEVELPGRIHSLLRTSGSVATGDGIAAAELLSTSAQLPGPRDRVKVEARPDPGRGEDRVAQKA